MMTILEVLESAAGYLRKHKVEAERLNAEHLLAKALGCKRLDLYLQFDRPLSEEERAPLRDFVRRRAGGEPLQHILGEWDFYGRTFLVDARALIPRPETELLAEKALAAFPAEHALRVLDCGTGTGVLALTMGLERPTWSVTGSDLSPDALALALANHAHMGSPENVDFLEADLIPENSQWDLIVANLPYIPSADLDSLSPEVRHDPRPALDGGADGLEIFRAFAPRAFASLRPGGRVLLEFGAGQEDALQSLLGENGFSGIMITKDYQAIPRILEATKAE